MSFGDMSNAVYPHLRFLAENVFRCDNCLIEEHVRAFDKLKDQAFAFTEKHKDCKPDKLIPTLREK